MKITRDIRKATAEDAENLKKCMNSAYSIYEERMGGIQLPPMETDYLSEINTYPTWIVESEGKVLGGLIMMFETDQASIANVAVDPKYQGHGIGKELMRFAESMAKEKDYSELLLTTHILLDENIALYNHLGWRETGRTESKVYMAKEI